MFCYSRPDLPPGDCLLTLHRRYLPSVSLRCKRSAGFCGFALRRPASLIPPIVNQNGRSVQVFEAVYTLINRAASVSRSPPDCYFSACCFCRSLYAATLCAGLQYFCLGPLGINSAWHFSQAHRGNSSARLCGCSCCCVCLSCFVILCNPS